MHVLVCELLAHAYYVHVYSEHYIHCSTCSADAAACVVTVAS